MNQSSYLVGTNSYSESGPVLPLRIARSLTRPRPLFSGGRRRPLGTSFLVSPVEKEAHMTQAIKRGHTLALLTAAAALAVCLCPALVSAQTVPPLDHFKCYLSAEIPSAAGVFPGTEVFLQDQFTPAGVLIPSFAYRPVRFCNPVKKTLPDGTVTPVSDFNAHLTLYTLASSVLHPSRRVVISN